MSETRVADVLLRITDRRRERLDEALALTGAEKDLGSGAPRTAESNLFLGSIERHRGQAVIAEVKMGSPRIGKLVERIDPLEQARTYARFGAAALSVVVEPDFFYGSYELLAECKEASGLPAIAKDFVVHPLQLVWAAEAGADAVLLIAALHSREDLLRYAGQARGLGLVPLIETHDIEDVEKLEGAPWELVGINNRDLRTFEVDLEHSLELLPRLPAEALKVAESGIRSGREVAWLREAGFDAFLVGESLLLAENPPALLDEMVRGRPCFPLEEGRAARLEDEIEDEDDGAIDG